jgi:DNA mismatch repair ATPase MutS
LGALHAQVTFKFKLTDGACPKSYGPTVARAAGIPASIAERAIVISDLFEAGHHAAVLGSALAAPDANAGGADVAAAGEQGEGDSTDAEDAERKFKAVWAGLAGSVGASKLRELVEGSA